MFTIDTIAKLFHAGNDWEDGTPIIKSHYIVQARSQYGRVYNYVALVEDEAHANRLVELFTMLLAEKRLLPQLNKEWEFDHYAYGSDAYQDNYYVAEANLMDEEELDHARKNHLGYCGAGVVAGIRVKSAAAWW